MAKFSLMDYVLKNLADLTYDKQQNILFINYHENIIVDEAQVNLVIHKSMEIVDRKEFFIIVDLSKTLFVTNEARRLSARKRAEVVKAFAVILGNSIHEKIFNLFVTFSRPSFPAKAFENKEKALEWILKMKN